MKIIKKIKLINFKRFDSFEVDFDEKINLLIGDNEAGKSSILTAIDLVLSGSRNKIESLGLEHIFNKQCIDDFMASDRSYANLPKLIIELYLNEQNNPDTHGKNNSNNTAHDGLSLICTPDDDLGVHINEILEQEGANFPFEYYSIKFITFADQVYTGYKKPIKHIFVDNSQVSSEYAMKEYVKDIYYASLSNNIERFTHQHKYRAHKDFFRRDVLNDINNRLGRINFSIKTSSKSNLEGDLTILEDDISIENKGKGKQCIVKTELALNRADNDLDIVIIEEPENHLSHINMKKLILKISEADNKQVFIATHSAMISTRLDLRKTILLNSNNNEPLKLNDLSDSTAKFFIKAPDNNMLEFILSKKVILVEGDAEYILLDEFYRKVTGNDIESDDIHIISVDGKAFKRYLEISRILDIKTAVITDNDGDYIANCIENYQDYITDDIKIFADTDNARTTLEVALYQDNKILCDALFLAGRRKFKDETKRIDALNYMLNNKTDAALEILEKKSQDVEVPQYIKEAILWISA